MALPASTALGEVERPQAAKRPRTRGWGQQSTGKEEDVEVGLQYFGKRYYAPLLNRWVSADPLAVHAPGKADFNLYAYVHGMALKATDPLGLECGVNESCDYSPNAVQSAPAEAGFSQGPAYTPAPAPVAPAPSAPSRATTVGQPGTSTWQQRVAKDAVAAGYSVLAAVGSAVGYFAGRVFGQSDTEAVKSANVTAGAVAQVAVPLEGAAAAVAVAGAHRQSNAALTQGAAPDAVSTSTAPAVGDLEAIANRLHDTAAKGAGVQPGTARRSGTVAVTQLDYPDMARMGPKIVTFRGDPRIGALVQKAARAEGLVWGGTNRSEHAEIIGKAFAAQQPEFSTSTRGWSAASNKVCFECQGGLVEPPGPILLPLNPKKW